MIFVVLAHLGKDWLNADGAKRHSGFLIVLAHLGKDCQCADVAKQHVWLYVVPALPG